jgi:hypothetical protein
MVFRDEIVGKIIARCGYPTPLSRASQTWERINGFLENRLSSLLSENDMPSLRVANFGIFPNTEPEIAAILIQFGFIYDVPSDFGRLIDIYPRTHLATTTNRENSGFGFGGFGVLGYGFGYGMNYDMEYPIIHQIGGRKFLTRKYVYVISIDYQRQISLDAEDVLYSNVDIDLENKLVGDVVDQELAYKAGGGTYYGVTNDLNKRTRRNMQRHKRIGSPRIGSRL